MKRGKTQLNKSLWPITLHFAYCSHQGDLETKFGNNIYILILQYYKIKYSFYLFIYLFFLKIIVTRNWNIVGHIASLNLKGIKVNYTILSCRLEFFRDYHRTRQPQEQRQERGRWRNMGNTRFYQQGLEFLVHITTFLDFLPLTLNNRCRQMQIPFLKAYLFTVTDTRLTSRKWKYVVNVFPKDITHDTVRIRTWDLCSQSRRLNRYRPKRLPSL